MTRDQIRNIMVDIKLPVRYHSDPNVYRLAEALEKALRKELR